MSETIALTLTDFLLARIAEDEALAREGETYVIEARPGSTVTRNGEPFFNAAAESRRSRRLRERYDITGDTVTIHGFDPARVLAECAAKRQIVDLVGAVDPMLSEDYDGGYASCWEDVLWLLAMPYADHPDYNESWRP